MQNVQLFIVTMHNVQSFLQLYVQFLHINFVFKR